MKDITGQRYGKLTAIRPTDKRVGSNVVWQFQCDCGNVVERTTTHLTDHSSCELCRPRGFGLRKDYSGQRFGRLVALECTGRHKGKELIWRLQCDCGNVIELPVSRFVGGKTSSCGCLKREVSYLNNPLFEDLVGEEFGLLTVESRNDESGKKRAIRWNCRCVCGNLVTASTTDLRDGKVRSCGCIDARRYCVYKLVSPDNRVYIGTIGIVPRRRWTCVKVYSNQAALLAAIEAFGGADAFRDLFHRYYYRPEGVWKEHLDAVPFDETNCFTAAEAEKLKRRFIKEYQSTDPQHGHNAATGGRKDFSFTDEAKNRQSQTKTGKDGRTDWCVYIHTNKINEKKYVGVTCRDPKIRWASGNGYRRPPKQGDAASHFYHAIQKYGWDNFDHEIIQNGMNHSEAALLEKELIAKYDTTNPQKGYNVTAGGDGSIGAKHSQATREKLSNIMKERFKDPNNNPFKGKHHTEESKEKMRESHKGMYDGEKNPFAGKHHSEKTKETLSKIRSEPVNQYSLDGRFIQQYASGKEAAEVFEVTPTAINEAAKGKTRFSAGYIWKKAKEAPPVGEPIDAAAVLGNSKHTGCKKAVDQYDLEGHFIMHFSSLAEAADAVGAGVTNISAAANGNTKTCKGFRWVFSTDTEKR